MVIYTIRVLNGKKNEFMTKMKEANIMTSQVHNRNDINSCVKEFEEELTKIRYIRKRNGMYSSWLVVRRKRFRIYN